MALRPSAPPAGAHVGERARAVSQRLWQIRGRMPAAASLPLALRWSLPGDKPAAMLRRCTGRADCLPKTGIRPEEEAQPLGATGSVASAGGARAAQPSLPFLPAAPSISSMITQLGRRSPMTARISTASSTRAASVVPLQSVRSRAGAAGQGQRVGSGDGMPARMMQGRQQCMWERNAAPMWLRQAWPGGLPTRASVQAQAQAQPLLCCPRTCGRLKR